MTMGHGSTTASRFRQAGLTYMIAGSASVTLTLVAELAPPSRAAELLLLVVGVGFVVLFGLAIYGAPWMWRRWKWTRRATRWLVRLLTLTAAGRTVLFGLSAAGYNVHAMRASGADFFVVRSSPEPLFLISAALTCLIAVMLARAGWWESRGG